MNLLVLTVLVAAPVGMRPSVASWFSLSATPYEVWSGDVNGLETEVWWDPLDSEPFIICDGELVGDAISFPVDPGENSSEPVSVQIEGAFLNGEPTLRGVIQVDEIGMIGRVVLTIGGGAAKQAGGDLDPYANENPLVNLMLTTCCCFGKGTSTGTCTAADCDAGESCGAERSCRWIAGAVFNTILPDGNSAMIP